jgi:hypothetical protein
VDIQLNGQQFAQTGGVCCPGVSDEEDELEESFDVHGRVYRTLGRQSQPINVIINVSNGKKKSKQGWAHQGAREARREGDAEKEVEGGGGALRQGSRFCFFFRKKKNPDWLDE